MIASCEDQAEFQLGVSFLIHGSLEKRPANHASGSALCICAALPQSGTRGLPDRDVQHIPPKQGARGRVGTATGRVRRLLLLRGREAYHTSPLLLVCLGTHVPRLWGERRRLGERERDRS